MRDTNAIEKAIIERSKQEIAMIVGDFITDVNTKLRNKYNECSFYHVTHLEDEDRQIPVMGSNQLMRVLCTMLEKGHMNTMVNKKSKELLNKLDLI